jgi:hypothetical protein
MHKLMILNYHTKQFQVVTTTNIRDFTILKTFKVTIHHPNAPASKKSFGILLCTIGQSVTLMELAAKVRPLAVTSLGIMMQISCSTLLNL